MFDHIGIVFESLATGGDFYRKVLQPLGYAVREDHTQPDGTGWLVFTSGAPESPFFVVAAGRPTFWTPAATVGTSPVHLAFRAPSREAVNRFHALGLAFGAADNGAPGVRRGRYYCAYLIDPGGNNVEAGVYG